MSWEHLNLDKVAAELAHSMVTGAKEMQDDKECVETLERLVTKTLGVLQEQGVYAMMLFLYSRTGNEKRAAPVIQKELFDALGKLPSFAGNKDILTGQADPELTLKYYTDNVLEDLDTLLLIRDLYEQTLIYARYGAKAAGGD